MKKYVVGICVFVVLASCAKDSPEKLAAAIADTYGDAMVELAALLESRPEPAEALRQLGDLRAAVIGKMIGFGKDRERVLDYEALNRQVTGAMAVVQGRPAFKEAQAAIVNAIHHYQQQAAGEVVQRIGNFNQIMFFWQLEVVRKQFTKEGLAHGIE